MLSRLVKELKCFTNSNSIILDYPKCKAEDKKVNLHYYHAEFQEGNGSDTCNVGDYLSSVIVELMLEQKGLSLDAPVERKKHLYAIGSILQMGYQNATIWGSGFAFEPGRFRALPHRALFRKLDVRCVRGPYTRKTLLKLGHSCPEVYGDPAVLISKFYRPASTDKKLEYLVIPHYSMFDKAKEIVPETHLINMDTSDYQSIIDRICSAEKVISSSLHGIILAETYGVPAIYYEDRPERFRYKYEDWYASTNREIRVVDGLEKAIAMSAPDVPDLSNMIRQLEDSFPYDLWK